MNDYSINDWYQEKEKQVKNEILRETEEQILGTDIEELTNYYFSQFKVEPIEFNGEITLQRDKGIEKIPAHKREKIYTSQGDLDCPYEEIIIKIPIKHNSNISTIAQYHSSPGYLNKVENYYKWTPDEINFSIKTKGYYLNLDEDTIKTQKDRRQEELEQLILWKNDNIIKGNDRLKEVIQKSIVARREEIEKDNQKFNSLMKKINIPLEEDPSVHSKKILLSENPIAQKVKPKPNLPEEYILEEEKVENLLDLFNNHALSFEKTPKTFLKFEEEELRDVLLSNLNTLFVGKATGETFSKKGKTDIYLNIDKGNILIFECKFWKGQSVFHDTIAQIRRYLTWRQNYAIIVFFVKQKDIMGILSKVPSFIKDDESYKSNFQQIDQSHFKSQNKIDDSGKGVTIHYLFYNLYVEL